MRRDALVEGKIYHIISRSIAGFKIFNRPADFKRIIKALEFYNHIKSVIKFSNFLALSPRKQKKIQRDLNDSRSKIVQITTYCIMPTHIHLILKQLKEGGISRLMKNLLDSYTRYFNVKYKRKGPLWESRFKNVLVKKDEQLLHLTRYVHLNPVSAHLIEKPEDWKYSSYQEYTHKKIPHRICDYSDLLEINTTEYRKFVNNQISYQRELAKIKNLLLDKTSEI